MSDSPWTRGVRGDQVLPLINEDPPTLRVPAGPGTGKTFGLRKRVLRLVHPDGLGLSPDRVLVCAFNRVIADDLRSAIADELEPYGLDPPDIRTIHALAAALADEQASVLRELGQLDGAVDRQAPLARLAQRLGIAPPAPRP